MYVCVYIFGGFYVFIFMVYLFSCRVTCQSVGIETMDTNIYSKQTLHKLMAPSFVCESMFTHRYIYIYIVRCFMTKNPTVNNQT